MWWYTTQTAPATCKNKMNQIQGSKYEMMGA